MGVLVPGGRTMLFGITEPYLLEDGLLEDGAVWPMAPQKSATVETQPKNFSML